MSATSRAATSRAAALRVPRPRLPLVLAALVGLVLAWLVAYPNLFVVGGSLTEGGGISLRGYRIFFGAPTELAALWHSVWTSLATVGLAGMVGIPVAFLFSRYDFPGRRMFAALAALPVLLPPLVGVIAFLFLYGESGIVTRSVGALLGMKSAPWRLAGASAILLVHTYSMYVYFYLFVSAGLARLDDAALEASASLGAGRWRTLWRVTLPMLWPSIGAAALLVFMASMASFSAAYIFGGGFRVLTTQIYGSKVSGELAMSMVETVVLASSSLIFLWLLGRIGAEREFGSVSKGVGRARKPVRSKAARAALTAAGTVGVTLLLLPHLTLLLVSFVPQGAWTTQILPGRYSLANYAALAASSQTLRPFLNSLRMATAATAADVLFCFVAAYLVVRGRFRGRGAIRALLVVPWALPGTVIAIGLATTFSAHQPWAGRFVLIGTFWILPMAYFIRNLPLVAMAAIASFRQFDPALEEASSSLGAGWITTMRRVAGPLVLPGLAAGGLLAFVTALGEFVSSIILYTSRSRPISIEILSQLRAFDFGAAAALGVALAALMALVFAAGGHYVTGGSRALPRL